MLKLIVVFLFPIAVFSQKTPPVDTISYKIDMENTLVRDIKRSAFEIYITSYSDSINNAIDSSMLPQFLKDPDFDYYNTNFWFPGVISISLRNIIIARVNNCSALKLIIMEKSNTYKMKPKKGVRIKYSHFSFFDLAKARFQLLNCNK